MDGTAVYSTNTAELFYAAIPVLLYCRSPVDLWVLSVFDTAELYYAAIPVLLLLLSCWICRFSRFCSLVE